MNKIVYLLIGYLFLSVFKGLKLKNPKPTKILFVGDSITAIKDKNNNSIKFTYPNYLIDQLTNIKIDVLALGGQTTIWGLKNLPDYLNNKYDRIYIYLGVNDSFNTSISLKKSLSNMQTMVNMVNKSGADCFIIQGINPVNFMDINKIPLTSYVTDKNDFIPMIAEYKTYQNELKNLKDCFFIDKFNLDNLTTDGIHPSAKGQKIIAETIKKSL
jgi:lysophospholipase L1-like esterase